MEAQKVYVVLDVFRDLIANIFGKEHGTDNWENQWKLQGVPNIVPIFHELRSTIAEKQEGFLPTLRKCLL